MIRGRIQRRTVSAASAAVLSFLLAACGEPGVLVSEAAGTVRVGVLPDSAKPALRELYEPLLAYLASATGLDFELSIPEDYDALLEAFDAGKVDLAWFGGLTFCQANARSSAQPLVSRDIDMRFTTVFIVAGDAQGDSIEAFAGKPFAFGPRLSTSGHLMPRKFLDERGIRPELFFGNVRYSPGHDETLAWVRGGVVAIGAVNGEIAKTLLRKGRFRSDEVRIVASTPPYQNYVWATREALDSDVRRALFEAFLALDPAVPDHAAVLGEYGAGGFVPVGPEAYDGLRKVARELGLLEELR